MVFREQLLSGLPQSLKAAFVPEIFVHLSLTSYSNIFQNIFKYSKQSSTVSDIFQYIPKFFFILTAISPAVSPCLFRTFIYSYYIFIYLLVAHLYIFISYIYIFACSEPPGRCRTQPAVASACDDPSLPLCAVMCPRSENITFNYI